MTSSYLIENSIDFFKEINSDSIGGDDDDTNRCFITGNILDDYPVTLPCNHTFNYDALFKDVYIHKQQNNAREEVCVPDTGIRCPYCRAIHHKFMLPEVEGKSQIFGINYYSEDLDLHSIYLNCVAIEKCSQSSCGNLVGKIWNGSPLCRSHLRRKILEKLYKMEQHYASQQINKRKTIIKDHLGYCNSVLKSGKRKGEVCGRSCVLKTTFCSIHKKNSINL